MNSLSFLFAWRYFRAKKSTNAINIIAGVSIFAITISTAALILVLSVFNGFEGLVKSLYSTFYPDIKVSAAQGKFVTITSEQLKKLRGLSGIRNYSLVVEEKAMLHNDEYQALVFLKGVDENYRYVNGVEDHLIKGTFNLGTEDNASIILGSGVESAIGVQTDRNLTPLFVYMPRRGSSDLVNPLNDISLDTINTAGTFVIQQDFDNKYGITNIGFLKKGLGLGIDEYSGVEIALKDPAQEEAVQADIQKVFGAGYKVQTRYQQNQSLYSVMRAEKWVIYAVLSLILVVAAFNMIGALTMLVLEKQKDISVLHALGAGKGFIQKIFLSEGLVLGIIGGVAGMLLALLLAWIQIRFGVIPLEGDSFLINHFPVTLKIGDFLLVSVTVLIIALFASWIPARKASLNEFSLRSE